MVKFRAAVRNTSSTLNLRSTLSNIIRSSDCLHCLCCGCPIAGTRRTDPKAGASTKRRRRSRSKLTPSEFPTTHGHFGQYAGKILIDFDRPAKSFTNFTVDATSVDVGAASFNDFVKSGAIPERRAFSDNGVCFRRRSKSSTPIPRR